jgi:hypothetical protein
MALQKLSRSRLNLNHIRTDASEEPKASTLEALAFLKGMLGTLLTDPFALQWKSMTYECQLRAE